MTSYIHGQKWKHTHQDRFLTFMDKNAFLHNIIDLLTFENKNSIQCLAYLHPYTLVNYLTSIHLVNYFHSIPSFFWKSQSWFCFNSREYPPEWFLLDDGICSDRQTHVGILCNQFHFLDMEYLSISMVPSIYSHKTVGSTSVSVEKKYFCNGITIMYNSAVWILTNPWQVVIRDANHLLFPIVFAFAEAKHCDCWEWFLVNLFMALGEWNNLTIVSTLGWRSEGRYWLSKKLVKKGFSSAKTYERN